MNVSAIAVVITGVALFSVIVSEHSDVERLRADVAREHAECVSRIDMINGTRRALWELHGGDGTHKLQNGL